MSYIKIKKIQKEEVDTPESGYIYLGYDDESVGGVGSGLWLKDDNGVVAHYVLSDYSSKPTITSFDPSSSTSVGNVLTINGTNFIPSITSVLFNDKLGTSVDVLSVTQLTVIVPDTTGQTNIIVSTAYGSSNSVSYTITPNIIKPQITRIVPDDGAVGSEILITGNYFVSSGTIIYYYNSTTHELVSGTTTVNSSSELTTIVPNLESGIKTVFLETINGQSNTSTFNVINLDPTFISFSPTSGSIGDEITIVGTNFFSNQVMVRFGSVCATDIDIHTSELMTVKIDTGTPFGETYIRVGNVSLSGFTVLGSTSGLLPTISSISPLGASTGSTITINGANFTDTINVIFSGIEVDILSHTSTSCEIYLNDDVIPGINSVIIINQYGSSSAFNYSVANPINGPVITQFNPISNIRSGSQNVYGNNFDAGGGNQLYFGNVPARMSGSYYPGYVKSLISNLTPIGTVDVRIVCSSGSYTKSGMIINASPGVDLPVITRVSPIFGKPGDIINVYGEYLSGCVISFGDSFSGFTTTTSIVSDIHVRTTIPNGIVDSGENKFINIYAITTGGTCTYSPFEVYSLPVGNPDIISISPTGGTVGTLITLSGYNFSKYWTDITMYLDDHIYQLDEQTFISENQITGRIPIIDSYGLSIIYAKNQNGSDYIRFYVQNSNITTTTTTTIDCSINGDIECVF